MAVSDAIGFEVNPNTPVGGLKAMDLEAYRANLKLRKFAEKWSFSSLWTRALRAIAAT